MVEDMKKGLSLKDVEGLDEENVEKLAELWITTAEELVSIASTVDGENGLSKQLGISSAEMKKIIKIVKRRIPPSSLEELERAPKEEYGMGALEPKE